MNNSHDITLVNFIFEHFENWLPVGCLSLMAALRKNGFNIDFRDGQLINGLEPNDEGASLELFRDSADIVAVSCYSHALPYLIRVLERLKRDEPGKKIILGGIGPVLVAGELLAAFDCFDVIVLGNEHEVLPRLSLELKKARPDLSQIDNIAYLDDGELILRTTEEGGGNFDQSLIPELEKIDLSNYHAFPLLLGKGCPYKCPFCCIPTTNPNYTRRNPELAREEISFLNTRLTEKRLIYLLDEAFLANREKANEFIEFAGQDQFRKNISFACDGRINFMDESLIEDLGENNFERILYGIESGSNEVIRKLNKSFTIEKGVEVAAFTKKHIKSVFTSFMYGFPFESYDEFLDTLYYGLYLSSLKVDVVFRLLSPLPGTALYREFGDTLSFSSKTMPQYSVKRSVLGDLGPVSKLVEENPGLFPSFYHYESPELGKKYAMAESYKSTLEYQGLRNSKN